MTENLPPDELGPRREARRRRKYPAGGAWWCNGCGHPRGPVPTTAADVGACANCHGTVWQSFPPDTGAFYFRMTGNGWMAS